MGNLIKSTLINKLESKIVKQTALVIPDATIGQLIQLQTFKNKVSDANHVQGVIEKEIYKLRMEIAEDEKVKKLKEMKEQLKWVKSISKDLTQMYYGAHEALLADWEPSLSYADKVKLLNDKSNAEEVEYAESAE